jgi:hypothetical protein
METLPYDLAFLARILYDAAGREPSIAVRDVTLVRDTATVQVEQVGASVGAFGLRWVARDRFGVILGGGKQPFSAFPAGGSITFSIPAGSWTVDVVIQPSTGEPAWGAGARILDFGIAANPDVSVLARKDSIQITPRGPDGATQHVVDLLDGRGRVLVRERISGGVSATIAVNRIETPRAEVRVHALDTAGRLVGQALRTIRIRGRTGMENWLIHFWNNSGVLYLPQPLLVRHLDAYTSLGVSAYFPLTEPHPGNVAAILRNDIVTAADRLAVSYSVEASAWLANIGDGGQSPPTVGGPCIFRLTDGATVAAGMTRDTALARACTDLNILYYRIGGDEPHSVSTDVSFDGLYALAISRVAVGYVRPGRLGPAARMGTQCNARNGDSALVQGCRVRV